MDCPYCESREIQSIPLDADGPITSPPVRCGTCESSWDDVHRLTGVEEVNNPDPCEAHELPPQAVLVEDDGGVADTTTRQGMHDLPIGRDGLEEVTAPEEGRGLIAGLRMLPASFDGRGEAVEAL